MWHPSSFVPSFMMSRVLQVWQLDRAGQQAERIGMEAEDARCHLLYGKERVTIAREGGLMLTEERDVRREGCETITVPPSPEICEKRVNKGNPNPLE